MKQSILKMIWLLVLVSSVHLYYSVDVQAKPDEEKQIEEFIKGNNYLPAKKAITMFEQQHDRTVSLPKRLPFRPSHKFGQITNEGDLRLHYLRVFNKPHQDFIFSIMSPESKIDKHITPEDKVITLRDGTKAYYQNANDLNTLIFKKKGWGYIFSGNLKQSKDFGLEGLIEIAESI
ncbi:autoinducer [Alkalihalobacillus sp. MEB130]|uniref:autoinducer n=1 Tax=Alkalihalobacillus sp. MEB130 TaxID=2976704 RepID=UPI0028DECDF6|nr:autoinducer [Alkalihalobacillus sp. MEB130]MDT8861277.1 autoinducer [Alkalihalobacillus sp. MEB130]